MKVKDDDVIYRQDAINAIWHCTDINLYVGGFPMIEQTEAFRALDALPSAEFRRKTGWWIENDNGTWSCSQCQSWIPDEQRHYARFCLCCGAEMKGRIRVK